MLRRSNLAIALLLLAGCCPRITEVEKAKEYIAISNRAQEYESGDEVKRRAMILENLPSACFDKIESLGGLKEQIKLKEK